MLPKAFQNEIQFFSPNLNARNSVTESASLKSLESQGGDLVEGSSKWDYVRVMSERYQGVCRKEKRLILDELEKNLKVHRKSAVRVLNSIKNKKPNETRGRHRIYNEFVVQHLKKLWLAMGQLCSRRMKKALPRWLRNYEAPEVTKYLLMQMSKTTVDAYLRPYKSQYRRHWNSGTRPGKYIKTMIPLKPLDYNVTSIGHVEADTVHHCGGSLSGVYALTLTVVFFLEWDFFHRFSAWDVIHFLDEIRNSQSFWNYFSHRFTTSVVEGINRAIKGLKWQAYGYKDMVYFALKIMQKLGYLNHKYALKWLYQNETTI